MRKFYVKGTGQFAPKKKKKKKLVANRGGSLLPYDTNHYGIAMPKSLCSLEIRSGGAQARRKPRREALSPDGNFAAPKTLRGRPSQPLGGVFG